MKHIALVLGLATLSTPAFAVPISFTGAEFATLPGITFPTGIQTIVGDSLRIDATNSRSIVAALPLDSFNVDVSDFEVQFNMTRLRRDDGIAEQNPFIYLSDGRNLFGGFFFDVPLGYRTGARRDELGVDGQSLILRQFLGNTNETPVPVNGDYLATIRIRSSASNTIITSTVNNGLRISSGTTATLFNPGNGGASLLFSSDFFSENYLINSVTFTRGVSAPAAVPEPGALGGMLLGLTTLGFGLYRRRFA